MEQYKDINGEFSIPEEETTSTPEVASKADDDLAPVATDNNSTAKPAVVQSVSPESANSPLSATNGASEQDNDSSPAAEENSSSSGDSGPSPERDSVKEQNSSSNAESNKEEKMDCNTASDDKIAKQKPVSMEVDEAVLDTAPTEKSSKGFLLLITITIT